MVGPCGACAGVDAHCGRCGRLTPRGFVRCARRRCENPRCHGGPVSLARHPGCTRAVGARSPGASDASGRGHGRIRRRRAAAAAAGGAGHRRDGGRDRGALQPAAGTRRELGACRCFAAERAQAVQPFAGSPAERRRRGAEGTGPATTGSTGAAHGRPGGGAGAPAAALVWPHVGLYSVPTTNSQWTRIISRRDTSLVMARRIRRP